MDRYPASAAPSIFTVYFSAGINRAPLTRTALSLIASYFVDAQNGVPSVPPEDSLHNGFPYGQCTYYVATRRAVDWSGNAIAWWRAARGKRPEGRVPVEGATACATGFEPVPASISPLMLQPCAPWSPEATKIDCPSAAAAWKTYSILGRLQAIDPQIDLDRPAANALPGHLFDMRLE